MQPKEKWSDKQRRQPETPTVQEAIEADVRGGEPPGMSSGLAAPPSTPTTTSSSPNTPSSASTTAAPNKFFVASFNPPNVTTSDGASISSISTASARGSLSSSSSASRNLTNSVPHLLPTPAPHLSSGLSRFPGGGSHPAMLQVVEEQLDSPTNNHSTGSFGSLSNFFSAAPFTILTGKRFPHKADPADQSNSPRHNTPRTPRTPDTGLRVNSRLMSMNPFVSIDLGAEKFTKQRELEGHTSPGFSSMFSVFSRGAGSPSSMQASFMNKPSWMISGSPLQQQLQNEHRDSSDSSLVHKVDWRVLPLLCLLAAIVCMDRTTLPMSSFQMRLKLSFGPDVYGWAVGVLYIGYALAYMPALLLVGKVPSSTWLGGCMCAWGAVGILGLLLQHPWLFYLLRGLQGVFEAAVMVGCSHLICSFYPWEHSTRRRALLVAAGTLGAMAGALWSPGAMRMDGTMDLDGWQWVAIIEGSLGVAAGILAAALLPASPATASWLGEDDTRQLSTIVRENRAAGIAVELDCKSIRGGCLSSALAALANKNVLLAGIAMLLCEAASVGRAYWVPQLVYSIFNQVPVTAVDDARPSWHAPANGSGNGWVPYMQQMSNRGSSEAVSLLTALMYATAFLLQLLSTFSSSLCLDFYFHSSLPLVIGGVIFFFFPITSKIAPLPGYIFLALPLALAACARTVLPSLTTSLLDPDSQPLGSGIIATFTSLGGLVAPAVVGSILQHTHSFRVPAYILAAASVGSGVLVLLSWQSLALCKSSSFGTDDTMNTYELGSPRCGNRSSIDSTRARRSVMTAAAAMEGISRINAETASPRSQALPPRSPMHPARLTLEQPQLIP